MYKGS
jgi:hypothetical protein